MMLCACDHFSEREVCALQDSSGLCIPQSVADFASKVNATANALAVIFPVLSRGSAVLKGSKPVPCTSQGFSLKKFERKTVLRKRPSPQYMCVGLSAGVLSSASIVLPACRARRDCKDGYDRIWQSKAVDVSGSGFCGSARISTVRVHGMNGNCHFMHHFMLTSHRASVVTQASVFCRPAWQAIDLLCLLRTSNLTDVQMPPGGFSHEPPVKTCPFGRRAAAGAKCAVRKVYDSWLFFFFTMQPFSHGTKAAIVSNNRRDWCNDVLMPRPEKGRRATRITTAGENVLRGESLEPSSS